MRSDEMRSVGAISSLLQRHGDDMTSVNDVIVAETTQLVTSSRVVGRRCRLSAVKDGVGRQPGDVEVGVASVRGVVGGSHVTTGARRGDAHLDLPVRYIT